MDQDWLEQIRARIDQALDHALGKHLGDSRLLEAARYSVLRGGKRLRPALVYAAADAVGASRDAADTAAISVELLHAYSLIHDDLPAMDDDALRRGQPTTHIAFDEATAILAGDALQALAFSILGEVDARTDSMRVKQLRLLGEAVGFRGMALGQAIDLESEGKALSLDALKAMHAKKTGALITASVLMGAACGNPSARSADGQIKCHPVAENVHVNGILDSTLAPANIDQLTEKNVTDLAKMVALKLNYVGVMAVEFFISGREIFVNEIAPRPHNSGHSTIDDCYSSQFDQQVRTLTEMPIGNPMNHSNAFMINLLGDSWELPSPHEPEWIKIMMESNFNLHLYGKFQTAQLDGIMFFLDQQLLHQMQLRHTRLNQL